MQLTSGQVVIFLLSISIMLLFAKLFGELFNKLKQPAIIGEILAGILLGPTILGNISPDTFNWLFPAESFSKIALDGITTLAVILLLLVSGLEVDLAVVLKHRKTAVSTSIIGIIIPFGLGAGITYFSPDLMGLTNPEMRLVFSLFIGTAIAISSLPIIAKILIDLKIFKSQIGFIIISAAMLNDVIGWLIFSVILGMTGAELHGFTFSESLMLIIIFIIVVLFVVRRISNKLIPWVQNNLTFPGGILNFILILGFLGAAFTEYIGIHAILGAFIMGIAIGDSVHLTERTREVIQQFVTNIFAPLFFVSIGIRVNFIENFDLPVVVILLGLAFAGKVTGCGLGAYMGGLKKNDALAVGFGMSSSGAMGIILGLLALQYGIIPDSVFVGLVVMALVTSMTSAPLLNYFIKEKKKYTFEKLLDPGNVFYTDVNDKESIIKFLSAKAGQVLKINSDEILTNVLSKPVTSSNYTAIPNTRLNIEKPFLSAAINKTGLNFNSSDKKPVRLIILLIIPKDESELQLKLLSEIANKLSDHKKVEELLGITDEAEFVERVRGE
jgi:Kef-type K+ transport system membrane component KefB/mannitol/fructose-specific phosphotransferase system IIA component (Ntr-type)